MPATLASDPKP
uniref:Uncharacterized protein n=1 Tax=Arundo donax TaxID=35708 RepID=A0A0A9MPI0_ARUDO